MSAFGGSSSRRRTLADGALDVAHDEPVLVIQEFDTDLRNLQHADGTNVSNALAEHRLKAGRSPGGQTERLLCCAAAAGWLRAAASPTMLEDALQGRCAGPQPGGGRGSPVARCGGPRNEVSERCGHSAEPAVLSFKLPAANTMCRRPLDWCCQAWCATVAARVYSALLLPALSQPSKLSTRLLVALPEPGVTRRDRGAAVRTRLSARAGPSDDLHDDCELDRGVLHSRAQIGHDAWRAMQAKIAVAPVHATQHARRGAKSA